jgi:predicted enzyme related to lactoylglutathione lyase
MIKDIAFTAYPAKDVKALREWYVSTLGLKFGNPFEQEGVVMYDEAQIGSGWFSLMSNEWMEVAAGSASGIAFEVDDIDATKNDLVAKGVTVPDVYDTPVCRVVSIKDAEGNKVTFHQSTLH